MDGRPSGGVYLISPLVNLAAEARTAAMGVLFLGSPIPRLMTASPRSRSNRASSLSAKVGDSAISQASLLSFIDSPSSKVPCHSEGAFAATEESLAVVEILRSPALHHTCPGG